MAAASRDDEERFMAAAVEAARKGLGRTAPNPAVGCVLVRGGRIIATGYHRRAGLAHAEADALAKAGSRARGAHAYVTLEPCVHHGRTPPCADALIAAGVKAVTVGAVDPDPRVRGKGMRALRRAGLDVYRARDADACLELIRGFAHWVHSGQPRFTLKLAASLDGCIAAKGGASRWITTPASRRIVHEMRNRADAVLVGVGTVLADDPKLTCRMRGGRNPLRVVLDRRLRTRPDAAVVRARGSLLLVARTGASKAARRRLEAAGAEVWTTSATGKRFWRALARELGRRGLHDVLVEGGAEVAGSLLASQMVTELVLFYNPRLIGGDGVPLIGSLGVRDPSSAPAFRTLAWSRVGDDLMWRGEPK